MGRLCLFWKPLYNARAQFVWKHTYSQFGTYNEHLTRSCTEQQSIQHVYSNRILTALKLYGDAVLFLFAAIPNMSVGGVKVSMVAFQAVDPGSIPGWRMFFFLTFFLCPTFHFFFLMSKNGTVSVILSEITAMQAIYTKISNPLSNQNRNSWRYFAHEPKNLWKHIAL